MAAKWLSVAPRAGHKLNPLSSVLIFAPVSSIFLLFIGLFSDPPLSISDEVLKIGELTFFANAIIAFLLNIAVYIAIQVADALIYAMAGIVKARALRSRTSLTSQDMCIIAGSDPWLSFTSSEYTLCFYIFYISSMSIHSFYVIFQVIFLGNPVTGMQLCLSCTETSEGSAVRPNVHL